MKTISMFSEDNKHASDEGFLCSWVKNFLPKDVSQILDIFRIKIIQKKHRLTVWLISIRQKLAETNRKPQINFTGKLLEDIKIKKKELKINGSYNNG